MSLCLDHNSPRGREVLEKLLAETDVTVLGAPEATLKRQGLDYETLAQVHSRLVYLNVSAFTSVGPRANEVGFDGVGQAMSGAAHMSGFGDTPTRSMCAFVDVATGIYSAFAIVCALMERDRTGKGHKIETSLMLSSYSAMSWFLVEQAVTGRNRTRSGNRAQSSGPSDLFRTRDGWIVLQVVGDGMFARIARVIGKSDWIDDVRFRTDKDRAEHGALLSEAVDQWCCDLSTEEVLAILRDARVPGARINSLQEALDEPQVDALQFIQTVEQSGLDQGLPLMKAPILVDGALPSLRSSPPQPGEHTDLVLRRAGYSPEEIEVLRLERVV